MLPLAQAADNDFPELLARIVHRFGLFAVSRYQAWTLRN
jgi:hypothetical protein